jgi:DNA polymerase III subunit gamma/tau
MSDKTFYLKYRPQKINDLDLQNIRQDLSLLLSSDNLPHAFLFSGPKGLGKTSAARIIAKAINCPNKKKGSFEPCNKCSLCQAITNGLALDLIEIDAASNRGIDDIRSLREKIKLTPYKAQKKVYVIDEVHMLTQEAFNALLKTLEEPPKHAVFILCTTEPHKLPETIISRCYQFKFTRANIDEVKRSLKRIEAGEKLKLETGALDLIAEKSGGSFRDATKTLELLTSLYGKNLKTNKIKDYFSKQTGLSDEFLSLLVKKEVSKALVWLETTWNNGADLKEVAVSLLELLRKVLLSKFNVLDEEVKDYDLNIDDIKKLVFLFDTAGRQLKGASIPTLPLEVAVIDWCETKDKKDSNKNSKKIDKDLEAVKQVWFQFLQKVKIKNHSLEALLKAAKPLEFNNEVLLIEVLYPFHKERLETKEYLSIVENILKELTNLSLKIKYKLPKGGD